MAHHFIFDPDPLKPSEPPVEGETENGTISPAAEVGTRELAELATKFTRHGGGRVSPEISVDLALDVVLNEIAGQACLATPASGAAIVLKRDGEWICRASSGQNTPSLGARLDGEAGLSGNCIKTRQVQRCDDAHCDQRADVEACRTLGVRAVIILPLLQSDQVVGVFEAFAPYPAAFGGRDEQTLKVLSERVLTLLKQASGTVDSLEEVREGADAAAEDSILEGVVAENTSVESQMKQRLPDEAWEPQANEVRTNRRLNRLTWTLGAAVFAMALLLTVRLAQRLIGRPAAAAHPQAASSRKAAEGGTHTSLTTAGSPSASPSPSTSRPSESSGAAPTVPHAKYSPPPPGSLFVYESGKEIFRMVPAAEQGLEQRIGFPADSGNNAAMTDRSNPIIEGTGIYQLPADRTEGALLHRVEPDYPEEARRQQIQGSVVLDVHIGRDGTVQSASLLSGERSLADAALMAVKQWRFKPQVVKGRVVEMQTRVTLNFRLPP